MKKKDYDDDQTASVGGRTCVYLNLNYERRGICVG